MPNRVQKFFSCPHFTQQAYRYGIALACFGVLLNWLGIAQSYIEPVRYIGVGFVMLGSILIILAMLRTMYKPGALFNFDCETSPHTHDDLHIVEIPLATSQSSNEYSESGLARAKPPDYYFVVDKPPTYDEAMSMIINPDEPHSSRQLPGLHIQPEGRLLNNASGLSAFAQRFSSARNSSNSCSRDSPPYSIPNTPPPQYTSTLSISGLQN